MTLEHPTSPAGPRVHRFDQRPLSIAEARVLGTLMEKARTVPDSYPLTLNSLQSGCNQKSSRDPVMTLADALVLEALDELRGLHMVMEGSGSRVTRYEHNFARAVGVRGDLHAVVVGGLHDGAQLLLGEERGLAALGQRKHAESQCQGKPKLRKNCLDCG